MAATNVHEALEIYLEKYTASSATECQLVRGQLDLVLANEGLAKWYANYQRARSDLEYFIWPDDALAGACREGGLLEFV